MLLCTYGCIYTYQCKCHGKQETPDSPWNWSSRRVWPVWCELGTQNQIFCKGKKDPQLLSHLSHQSPLLPRFPTKWETGSNISSKHIFLMCFLLCMSKLILGRQLSLSCMSYYPQQRPWICYHSMIPILSHTYYFLRFIVYCFIC